MTATTTKTKPKTKTSQKPTNNLAPAETVLQFNCLASELNLQLSLVCPVIPSRPTHPILSNVLIVADFANQEVGLTACDCNLSFQTSFKAEVIKAGTGTLPAMLLTSIVSLCTGQICLTQIKTNNSGTENYRATLHTIGAAYQINGLASEEFPLVPTSTHTANTFLLPATALKAAIKATSFAASKDETKQVLNGVRLNIEDRSFELAATDGNRLAVARTATAEEHETTSITIPAKTIRVLDRILNLTEKNPSPAPIKLSMDAETNTLYLSWGQFQISSPTLEGEYPPYSEMLQTDPALKVAVDRKELIAALERLNTLSQKNQEATLIKLDYKQQKIQLAVERSQGQGSEELIAAISGEANFLQACFSIQLLLDGVKSMEAEQVQLHLTDPKEPGIITPFGNRNQPGLDLKSHYLIAAVAVTEINP